MQYHFKSKCNVLHSNLFICESAGVSERMCGPVRYPRSPEGIRFLATRVTDVYELPNSSAGI